jgi:hypothetical protein
MNSARVYQTGLNPFSLFVYFANQLKTGFIYQARQVCHVDSRLSGNDRKNLGDVFPACFWAGICQQVIVSLERDDVHLRDRMNSALTGQTGLSP